MDLVKALWNQIKGIPPNPWEDDPDILAARQRQHELGISDYVTQRKAEAEWWRRQVDRRERHD